MSSNSKQGNPGSLRYVLVTPARNEAAFIEQTIRSVLAQDVIPNRWVIVSDGSTDGTDEIVRRYAAQHDWIELVSLPARAQRNFAGKVTAFNAGRARLSGMEYDAIGNLDADVTFGTDYFSFLLRKLGEDSALGLVGTPYRDTLSGPYDYRFASVEHVTGPCQLFRRQCFDDIGGYLAVKGGAVDRIADIAARMKGWKTRRFPERVYQHLRHTGTAEQSVLTSKFKDGIKDYSVGSSPLWEMFRTIYQMTKKPFIVGSLMEACGYASAMIRRADRPVPPEMVEFCRREQLRRLKALLPGKTLKNRVSQNYFTVPFYIPRIFQLVSNWPRYLSNYFLRSCDPAEYRLRNGVRLVDGTGALAGTMAVVFVRREYGTLRRFRTIVDIGAHLGSFAVYAAMSCPNARIYCYEPERRNFGLLEQNIRINGMENRISAYQCAVASKGGQRDLAVGDSLLNSFHIAPQDGSVQKVNCTTLNDILTTHELEVIDLLKVNCEGAEYEILESCSAADFERIANIRLEYHNLDTPRRNGECLSELLQARGYRIERFSRYRNSSGFIWATRACAEDSSRHFSGLKGLADAVARVLIASVPTTLPAI